MSYLINGRAFKPNEWSTKGLPIIRIQNLNDDNAEFNYCDFQVEEKYLVDTGQLLFAWSGTPGTSFGAHIWKKGKAVLNQHIFKVEINEKFINKSFLMYSLNYNLNEYIGKAHGAAGLAHITKGKFENSLILLPPINEQHRIVSKLEELFTNLDAGIEYLKNTKILLKQYRQSVLRYAFEGKLTEKWRKGKKHESESARKSLDRIKQSINSIQNVNDETIKYDIQKNWNLPEEWTWTKLKDVSQINPNPENKFSDDLEVSFLPMKNVEEKSGRIDLSLTRKLSEVKKGYTPFIDNDIIFAKITPCMENGKIAIVKSLKNGFGYGSTEFHVIRLPNSLPRKYFFFYLLRDDLRKDAQRHMKGTAGQLRVPPKYLQNLPIPFPPIEEQNKIISEIERIVSVIENAEKIINSSLLRSKSLHSSILRNAFEGKLVPQDRNDEPASNLLEKINQQAPIAENKSKNSKGNRNKSDPKQRRLI